MSRIAFGIDHALGALLLASAALSPALALETDQYYAWGRDLRDSAEVINAKVNLEIAAVLEHVNERGSARRIDCDHVVEQVASRLNWFIFHDIEIWVNNSPLVARIPATPDEERLYLKRYLYHLTGLFDPGTKVPPSPTIEVGGIRIGTDKIAHFFSQGWWYHKAYRNALREGASREDAEARAVRRGIFAERTILGWSWGIFSTADLEANHQGLRFFAGLCEGEAPVLVRTAGGWESARAFDLRDWVTPEWDESFQPQMFGPRRWERVLPVLREYCPLLDDPWVVRRREEYARRDRETETEREVARLVADGSLPDPEPFTLRSACEAGRAEGAATAAATAD